MGSRSSGMTHCSRLVRTLTVGLTLGLSLFAADAHATKPLPPPPEEISLSPEVRFLTPAAGAKLKGVVAFRLAAGAVDKIKSWQFGTAGELNTTPYPIGRFSYTTTQLKNGPHTFIARASYESGAVAEAKLQVVVYNPSHQLREINMITYQPLDGRDAIVELTYTKPGLKLDVDLSEMDSNFDKTRVSVNEVRAGVYRIVYPISSNSSVPPGRRRVQVSATNRAGEVVTESFEWELRKHPLMPIIVKGCQFSAKNEHAHFSYETYHSQPEVKFDPKFFPLIPGNVHVSAAPSLEVGQAGTLRVEWTLPKLAPQAPLFAQSQDRVLVTAHGYTGYYLCWVPQGETRATLNLELKAPGVYSNIRSGEPVPKEVRLNVTVERAGFAEAWRQHAFKITLPTATTPAVTVPATGAAPQTGTAPPASGKRKQKRKVRPN